VKVLRIPKGMNRMPSQYSVRSCVPPLTQEELEQTLPSGSQHEEPMSDQDLRRLYEFGVLEVRDWEEWGLQEETEVEEAEPLEEET